MLADTRDLQQKIREQIFNSREVWKIFDRVISGKSENHKEAYKFNFVLDNLPYEGETKIGDFNALFYEIIGETDFVKQFKEKATLFDLDKRVHKIYKYLFSGRKFEKYCYFQDYFLSCDEEIENSEYTQKNFVYIAEILLKEKKKDNYLMIRINTYDITLREPRIL